MLQAFQRLEQTVMQSTLGFWNSYLERHPMYCFDRLQHLLTGKPYSRLYKDPLLSLFGRRRFASEPPARSAEAPWHLTVPSELLKQ